MIAIPVKYGKPSDNIMSDLYGNAEYFALCNEDGYVEIVENSAKGNGGNTAAFIIDTKVKATAFTHMGKGLYKKLAAAGIEVSKVSNLELPLEEVVANYYKGNYPKLNDDNYDELLDPGGTGSCQCGCE